MGGNSANKVCTYKRCSSLSSVGSRHKHGFLLGRTDREIKHAAGIGERMGVPWIGERVREGIGEWINGGFLVNLQGRSCPAKVSEKGQGKSFRSVGLGELWKECKDHIQSDQLLLNKSHLTLECLLSNELNRLRN